MGLRILFLTAQVPYPPRLGGALRNFGMISGLARRNQVSLLSLLEPGQPDPESTPLMSLCKHLVAVAAPHRTRGRRLRELLAGHADIARRLWLDAFAETLRTLLAENHFDVVHVGGLEMASYLEVVRARAFDGLTVFDDYNAEAALQRRIFEVDVRSPNRWHAALYSFIQWRRLIDFETKACRQSDRILAVSPLDAKLLQGLNHTTPVSVIPNAINVSDYQVDGQLAEGLPHPTLVFTGKMDYRPNVDAALWFAREVLPDIRARFPGAHFAVVGQKPHARLATLRADAGVTLTGAVEDIKPYIASADIYVVPMRMGSGTRFKVLEAMAMRRAIVSTSLGAQGLDVESGEQLYVADGSKAFADAIVSLLEDPDRRQRMGQAAYTFVSEGYDWEHIIPRLEEVYESA